MRLFNDATEYGLRAMVWMTNQPRGPHKLQAIAEAIGAAPCYLIKVLQLLTRAGIVSAHRGITGVRVGPRSRDAHRARGLVCHRSDRADRADPVLPSRHPGPCRRVVLAVSAHRRLARRNRTGICADYHRDVGPASIIARSFVHGGFSDAVACGSACDGSECTMKKERANCEQGGAMSEHET